MQWKLNQSERWGAIMFLAGIKKGQIKYLRLARKSLETLRINEEEQKELQMIVQGSSVQWDKKKGEHVKEFNVDKELLPFLKTQLQELSDNDNLTSELIDIAEKVGVE